MAGQFECKGLDCPYVMLGETTVWHDDSRFRECQQVLDESPSGIADNPRAIAESPNIGGPEAANMCGYAVQAIRKMQGWDPSQLSQQEVHNA